MPTSDDTLENAARRPYHIAVGLVMLTFMMTTIVAGVRVALG
jgi:hypothetical protein